MTSFYDAQARSYEWTRKGFLRGRKAVVDELAIMPGEQVLEIGCGTGWNLPLLAKKVGAEGRVVGLEVSQKMLDRARQKNLASQVELICGDATVAEVAQGMFDIILFSYSYSAIPERHDILARLLSQLQPVGRVGMVDFCSNPDMPRWINDMFRWWGRKHSCDFAADPTPVLTREGLQVNQEKQGFGFSYRLVALRAK